MCFFVFPESISRRVQPLLGASKYLRETEGGMSAAKTRDIDFARLARNTNRGAAFQRYLPRTASGARTLSMHSTPPILEGVWPHRLAAHNFL